MPRQFGSWSDYFGDSDYIPVRRKRRGRHLFRRAIGRYGSMRPLIGQLGHYVDGISRFM